MAKQKSNRKHHAAYLALGQAVWQHYRKRCYTHLTQAIRNGYIQSLPDGKTMCAYCGTRPASGWEHRDYTDPLNIAPTCHKCNAGLPPSTLNPSVVSMHLDGYGECPFGPHAFIQTEWTSVKWPSKTWPEWVYQFHQRPEPKP